MSEIVEYIQTQCVKQSCDEIDSNQSGKPVKILRSVPVIHDSGILGDIFIAGISSYAAEELVQELKKAES